MRGGSDAGISDITGTLLMAGAVVLAGGALTAILAQQLSATAPPSVALALAPVSPGDGSARIVLRNGEALNLTDISVSLTRNATGPAPVPRSSWTTAHPDILRAGDMLAFPLAPAAAADETIRVTIVHAATNTLLSELSGRAATSATLAYEAPLLDASLTPSTLVADATTASLLAVRVSHPAGNLAVASVVADLSNLTNASRSANATLPLLDTGTLGDALGGDGVYSGLLRAAFNTTPGVYNLTITATDVAGRASATTFAHVNISTNLVTVISNATTAIGNFTGNFTNATGILNGNCFGCAILTGSSSFEGTRLLAPTSENATAFNLRNWTWDRQTPSRLDHDVGVVRILSGSYAWSAHFTFEAATLENIPAITKILMWDANRTTIYEPTNGTYVNMSGLDLDLLDPTTNGFVCTEGCALPATYGNANIQGRPGFLVAWLKDETNNFQTDELGIFAMDVHLA